MAKITKRAEILESLHKLVSKEAELAQTNVSGEPCKDTKVTSVSESTETTDKNGVGADKLNGEQGYKQKPTDDGSEPLAGAKKAEDTTTDKISKLANDILSTINTKLSADKTAELAQTNISGVPCKDTKVTSVSDSTETTDKNGVGADKLNKEQGYEQKDTTDKSEPLKGAKKASVNDEAIKVASYDLGRQFCELLLNKSAAAKQTNVKIAEDNELKKEAGRRDFDTLIAQAAAELEQQQVASAELDKQAELQGAATFDEMYKQAQFESVVEENQLLRNKLAEYQAFERAALQKQAELREEQKFAKMAELVFEKIKNELKATAEPIGK